MVLWMTLAGLTWVGLITLLVYLLSGGLVRRGPGVTEPKETPLQIAQRRYASGELSEQDYERLKSTLR
jgi:uncharacterized membrane protein